MNVIDRANAVFEWTSGILWGPWLLALLIGTHIYLTVRLGFVQRWLGRAIRLTFRSERSAEGDVSPFGALATALAATVGAGNIVGVAVAVTAGGPGAIFWMWITGVLGIATKYTEALLAVQFRVRNERGEMSGGPMYVLANGLHLRWLGVLFALFTVVAAFGIGNMFQAKAVTTSVLELVPDGTPETPIRVACGLVMAVATGLVLIGGIKWIARFCEILVPFMIASYVIGCGIILAIHWDRIPAAFTLILSDAFSGQALAGGGLGGMIAAGVKRGLFSNESGLGSAPIVSMTGTFWDTVVVCLLTGLVLVVTDAWSSGLEGAAMTASAFGTIPHIGQPVLTLGLIAFVFSTLIGWSYYGEKSLEYLGGLRLIPVYRWLWVVAIFLGATFPSSLVINFSDSANALMAIPNLVSLLALSGLVARESNRWLSQPETFE
jgi:AGCS family alanine or glycine:cation symporter